MNQHDYVRNCQKFYRDNGLTPGNPDDGDWEEAHYPAPKGEGEDVVFLLHEHHQVQGLLQSEEYGRCCFFKGHTKRFLETHGFVTEWFKLWDLYDKWSSEQSKLAVKDVHKEKNEDGKSVNAVRCAKELHAVRDEEGRSVAAVAAFKGIHNEKNSEGKSVLAVRAGKAAAKKNHSKKTEDGKSEFAVRGGKAGSQALHDKKNQDGKSEAAVRGAAAQHAQRWMCTVTGYVTTPGPLSRYQGARGIPTTCRVRVG